MHTNASFSSLLKKPLDPSFKYRDRTSIIGDILSYINSDPKGKTKTSIMRGANLNLGQVNRYLHLLIVGGFIRAEEPLTSQELARYRLTRKGLSILREASIWFYSLDTPKRSI